MTRSKQIAAMSSKERKAEERRIKKIGGGKAGIDSVHEKKLGASKAVARQKSETTKKVRTSNGNKRIVKRAGLDGIARMTLKKLSLRGGAKRISAGAYNQIRCGLLSFYNMAARYAIAYTASDNRVTITERDLCHALEQMGHTIYGDPSLIPKSGHKHASTSSLENKDGAAVAKASA